VHFARGLRSDFAPVRSISTCVTYNTQAALPGESCNLSSMSCADYEACEHVGIAHDDLCGGSQTTRCQGNLAVNCGNYSGGDRFFDCAALGGTCGTLTDKGTLFADCKLDISPDSCAGLPSSDAEAFCHVGSGNNDDLRYYCWDGQAFGASCSSVASCVDTPDPSSGEGGAGGASEVGNAQCYFDTESCSGGDSASCNGDVATVCSAGSQFQIRLRLGRPFLRYHGQKRVLPGARLQRGRRQRRLPRELLWRRREPDLLLRRIALHRRLCGLWLHALLE
jgi:hypothetical protein